MVIGMSDEYQPFEQKAIIKVCGIGGGGGNAVNRMIEAGMRDVEFIAINTDAQALRSSPAGTRLQIGAQITGGLGSGAKPEVGTKAAMEDRERMSEVLRGADMIFITAGLGGGTGTGASPIIAEAARETGALTVAIVTLPFSFEGKERMQNALKGLEALEERLDTLIVVPNDRVATLCQNNVSFLNAFRLADEVLHNGVRAISELITVPGLINLDFADVRTIMQARGRALMGIGTAQGENRATRAAEEAIVCPLLEQSDIEGATGVIVNIKGGCDIGMREVQDAVRTVQKNAHPDANIIFGAVVDDEERPELQVTVIAAGFVKEVKTSEERKDEGLSIDIGETAAAFVDRGLANIAATAQAQSTTQPEPKPVAEEPKPEPVAARAEEKPTPPPLPDTASAPKKEQVEFLFPAEENTPKTDAAPAAAFSTADEDELGIPTFMRNRKKGK